VTVAAVAAAAALAVLPNTSDRVHVFDDQLASNLSPGLLRFVATHYDGSQKDPRSQIAALKRINPNFYVIQYRLALGLGRATQIIDGDRWIPEWPGRVQESWFTHLNGNRVFMKQWGWYLTNPDDPSWRARFTTDLRRQIADTGADGAFLDSASVPNEFGADAFQPPLKAYDPPFERAWSKKLERWLPYVRARIGKPVIANAGSWITTRDVTRYDAIDGVMIEGFAAPGIAPVDWRLQLTRALSLVRKHRIEICQAYPQNVQERMYALASYLLIKGDRTFVNLETGFPPDWFPEYDVDLGRALGPASLGGLATRRFERGILYVNPDDAPATVQVPAGFARVTPVGGGVVPDSGVVPASWRLVAAPVSTLTLAPREAAILTRG
jgi:hypothetical protein